MIKTDTSIISGYIEGYYGNILSWQNRIRILKNLKKNNLNSYFYCPKEDIYHRLHWRKPYPRKWLNSFKKFCQIASKLNMKVFCGISPGLDYDFLKRKEDFTFLISKARELIVCGAENIVLMFDDISDDFNLKNLSVKSEAILHAELTNILSKELNKHVLVVPRVYSDEIINNDNYIEDFCKNINKENSIFYCGKKIVAATQSLEEVKTITNISNNKVILWDNLYANDYCPTKIFLGPYLRRYNLINVMVNLTGMIETDLFLLDLISLTSASNKNDINWLNILKKHNIPKQFLIISEYFYPVNFINYKTQKSIDYNKEIEALDYLLWKWKTPLSREWYQYFLILKQCLQLLNNDLNNDRIRKIFPLPLKNTLINNK